MYEKLNLSPCTEDDEPQDFYSFVFSKLDLKLEMLVNIAKKENEDKEYLESLYKILAFK
jgi:hypothetical protein